MHLCEQALTIIHPERTATGTEYHCKVVQGSYAERRGVQAEGNGQTTSDCVRVRIPSELGTPQIGDYIVRGVWLKIQSLSDLNGVFYSKITQIRDNCNPYNSHWAVVAE